MRSRSIAARPLALILAVTLAGCSSPQHPQSSPAPSTNAEGMAVQPPAAPTRVAPEAPPPQDNGRLPDLAQPTRYALALTIDPTQARYDGVVRIAVNVLRATRGLVLHGRGLTIRRAAVSVEGQPANQATWAFRATVGGRGEPEELVLTFANDVMPGSANLEIQFDREFERDLSGLYRVHSGNDWYAYTQFEPNDARRAFPCFDEPSFKVPWDVTLTIPQGMTAIANMPEVTRTTEGANQVVHFAATPPTPSYLVAMAVGPFDVVQGQQTPVPIRAVTTRGQGALTRLILEAAAAHVRILGEYFDRPFPYPKLDLVAVPEFGGGAMENPGMITFREDSMLLDPDHAPTSARRTMAAVLAHELAHHWFGDLVTMTWWNDLWLNEGFATWMQAKVVDQWQPTFGARVDALRSRGGAMETDALPSARAVRQPVRNTSEAREAFDGITYAKGAAVLAMVERWLGEDVFRAGVRAYIHAHEWHNASAEDLLQALGHASGHDVSAVAASFLDQPGVPVVTAELTCPANGPPTLELSQSEYHVPCGSGRSVATTSSGSPGSAAVDCDPCHWRNDSGCAGVRTPPPDHRWQIPVCVDYEADGAPHRECSLLGDVHDTMPLHDAQRCPRWIYPNADEAGYYRYALTPAVRALATRATMAPMEVRARAGYADNAWALVRGGQLPIDDYLRTLDAYRAERERPVLESVQNGLWEMFAIAADDAARPAAATWVGEFFRPVARDLTWDARPGDDDDRRLIRRNVLSVLGGVAEDRDTLAEAERRAQAYFHDSQSIDPDTAAIAVPMASRRAPADRFDAIVAALAHARTPADRVVLIGALGNFDEPAQIRRALDVSLTDAVRVQDALRVVFTAWSDPRRRPTVIAWVHEHWDALRARIPEEAMPWVVASASGVCTPEQIQAENEFFTPRIHDLEGAERRLAESLQQADQCVALRRREHDHLAAFFARPAPASRATRRHR